MRGIKSRARAEAAPPDPVDIARSAGAGIANGVINAGALLFGDVPTGFGYLPNNLVANRLRRMGGYSDLPAEAPDWIRERLTAEPLRHTVENIVGELYKPRTRSGRLVETIGEMTPMLLVGEALGAVRGAQTLGTAFRELPGTLAKHAVAPGAAVHTLEETLPDSGAGETLQKIYPVIRRVLPAMLAAKRYYLSRRVAPQ